ncbi:MAG: hypothetical protein KF713_02840 [Turneriella sp.]|nr:hypothetical protein [Turneriella sp.]
MKSGQKIRALLFTVAALSVPGSAIASTNLTCKIDCPSTAQIEAAKDSHACCPKLAKRGKAIEKIAQKCDNCIESREIPTALTAQSQPAKTEIAAVPSAEYLGKSYAFDTKANIVRIPRKNHSHHHNSVSITLHRFLI